MTSEELRPLSAPRRKKRNLVGYWIALAGLLGAVALMVYGNLGQNLSYYLSPTQLKSQQTEYMGKTLRLGALVKPGSVKYDQTTLELRFTITDGYTEYPVHYRGAIPDLFKEGMGVVVEGQLTKGMFEGTNLLVKHSEEYKVPQKESVLDPQTLIQDPSL